MLQTARNVAIILALAAGVDFLPGGGAAAATVLSALTMIFLAAIAWLRLPASTASSSSPWRRSPTRARRACSARSAAIALLSSPTTTSPPGPAGSLLWVALMAGCLGIIFLIWRSATTY